jgi:hypothetical protein
MNIPTRLILLFFIFLGSHAKAQDLMDMLNDGDSVKTDYTYATFKATKIINGQSIELAPKGALNFSISHHFGKLNTGAYEFFGLDQANIRFGFDYGITDWLAVGIGRTSVDKTYDASAKVKILRQSKGLRNMPVSLTYFTNIAVSTLKWQNQERTNYFTSRMEYVHQLLVARKFGSRLSLQIMPTYIHRNLVKTKYDQNDVFAVGAGGRMKLTNRIAVTAEAYFLMPGQTEMQYYNSVSVGIDIETGGHVFQIYLTNSRGLIEEQFIPETTGSWLHGDIHLSFNIHRTFQLSNKKDAAKQW